MVWSRFYAALGAGYDLWNNSGWISAARQLYRADLEAISNGDRTALVRLLVSIPQSLRLPECEAALVDVLTKRESLTLRWLQSEARKRKALRPNKRQLEDVERFKEARRAEDIRRLFRPSSEQGKKITFRGAITSIIGEEPEVDTAARQFSENSENAFIRERTLYRVEHDVGQCPFHPGGQDVILPFLHGDDPTRDPECPGIKDPEPAPVRHKRKRPHQPELHLIAGLDG